jgi:hypothetical protein
MNGPITGSNEANSTSLEVALVYMRHPELWNARGVWFGGTSRVRKRQQRGS